MAENRIPEAWIEIMSEAEIRTRGWGGKYNFGFVVAMGRLIATHDRIGPAFRALFAEVMFESGHLSRREREMIAAVTAAAQDCHY
jgi:alkylhydroperoxidase/carboxymuconolactone decarboxylase family protein YurZ